MSESLWTAAHERLKQARCAYLRRDNGTLDGRVGSGLESKNLLTSLLCCGVCGGTLTYSKKWGARGRPVGLFICSQHRSRGNDACTNGHGVNAVDLTERALAHLKKAFLDPVALGALVMKEIETRSAAPQAVESERQEVTAWVAKLTQEIERLTEAIATGAAPTSVVQAIAAREKERRDHQAKLEHLNGLQLEAQDFDLAEFLEEVSDLLDDLRGSMEADVRRPVGPWSVSSLAYSSSRQRRMASTLLRGRAGTSRPTP